VSETHSLPAGAVPVDGFPGYYVTRDGSVWSINAWRGTFLRRLATFPDKGGYPRVRLVGPDGKRAQLRVHRLVAVAFLPPLPSPKHEVRHLDGAPTHCAVENLAWGTRAENAADKERHGRTYAGERHHSSRVTAGGVRSIRDACGRGISSLELATQYGVSRKTIQRIVTHKTWKRIQ
jgi:hypothetical protein